MKYGLLWDNALTYRVHVPRGTRDMSVDTQDDFIADITEMTDRHEQYVRHDRVIRTWNTKNIARSDDVVHQWMTQM